MERKKQAAKNLKVVPGQPQKGKKKKKKVREESTVSLKIRKQVQENIFSTSIYPEA